MPTFKKFVILTAIALSLGGTIANADTSPIQNWQIDSFHVDMVVDEHGKIDITENILANFANEEHRGMSRNIPYKNGDSKIKIDFQSATDENENSWQIEKYDSSGDLVIEMRNWENLPDNEKHTFKIKYTVDKIIKRFDTHDELYWNLNGTQWPLKINNISATIHLPNEFTTDQIDTICFTGKYGQTNKDCEIKQIDPKTIEVKATKELNEFENLTFAVKLPLGALPEAPLTIMDYIFNTIFLIGSMHAAIVFIIMLIIWYKHGRDEKVARTTVMPHYTPPKGMLPSEVGTLIDETINTRDITATIIDFAIRGYIKVTEIEGVKILFLQGETDYELELIKPYEHTKEYEKIILDNIFEINETGTKTKISSLKNEFYKYLPEIKNSIMNQLIKDGYFPHNPETIKKIYKITGIVIFFISIQAFVPFSILLGTLFTANLIISGLIIIGFSFIMPRKTKKGTETYYELKGLYEYINTAEKDRMKFQEEQNILFEKLLPYAMAFGLISKWTKAFEGIVQTPNWYETNNTSTIALSSFGHSIGNFGTNLSNNISSSPNSSEGSGFSGGSSGGGGGGGGGGGL